MTAPSDQGLIAQAARRLRSSVAARSALVVSLGLFVLAAAAPFLANRVPIWFSGADGVQFPVLHQLSPEDWFWFAVVILLATSKLLSGCLAGPWRRRLPWCFLAALAVVAVLCLQAPDRLQREQWQQWEELRAKGPLAGESVLWPLVAYGASEFDRELFSASAPSWRHPFGTDQGGRDVFARVVYGTRVSLMTGFLAVAIALSLGVLIGALAGYFGGFVDLLLSRVIEVVQCFPPLILILAITAFLPPTTMLVIVLIGILSWTSVARLVRSEFLRLRREEFVLAAESLGAGSWRIIRRHMLPNALAPVLVMATFGIANAMLTEASLSFLGLGVPPPTPSWGQILFQGRSSLLEAPWITLAPGLFVLVSIASFHVLGDQLRDALDPRFEKRLHG